MDRKLCIRKLRSLLWPVVNGSTLRDNFGHLTYNSQRGLLRVLKKLEETVGTCSWKSGSSVDIRLLQVAFSWKSKADCRQSVKIG